MIWDLLHFLLSNQIDLFVYWDDPYLVSQSNDVYGQVGMPFLFKLLGIFCISEEKEESYCSVMRTEGVSSTGTCKNNDVDDWGSSTWKKKKKESMVSHFFFFWLLKIKNRSDCSCREWIFYWVEDQRITENTLRYVGLYFGIILGTNLSNETQTLLQDLCGSEQHQVEVWRTPSERKKVTS